MTWVVVAVGLLLLIFVHELGHFTVALAVGIRPRSFYIGFPPALVKMKRNGIEYAIGVIPLGGLVRIPGMHRPAPRDLEAFMGPALREDPSLAPGMQRVRRALQAEDFAAVREALPEVRQAVENVKLSSSARRSANRALRDVEEGSGADAYWRAPTWKRIAVILAGPLMNVLVAFVIFFGVFATTHVQVEGTTRVAAVNAKTPAQLIGLHANDRIVAVDGQPTPSFADISRKIQGSNGHKITVTVLRHGKRIVLGPAKTIRSQDGRWILGFAPGTVERKASYSFGASARHAVNYCWLTLTGTAQAIAGMFHAKQRAQISGPVGIVRATHQALKAGASYYLEILGFVSMSLALVNLLPFLPLDGGQILFSIIEGVRRRALAREVYERVSFVGFSLIILIWIVALSNDLGGKHPG